MRHFMAILILIVLFLPSCTGSRRATAIPSPTAPTTSIPEAAPSPTPTPVAAVITAGNAASLQPGDPVAVQQLYQMSWSPDSKTLLVGDKIGLHTIASNGRGEIALTPTQAITGTLSFAQNGMLAALQDNNTVAIYSPNTLQIQQTLNISGTVTNAIVSPDGSQLAVTSADKIAATIYDLTTGQPTTTLTGFETAAPVYGVQFDRDWQTMIWIARATVQLMDVATGQLGARFEHEDFVGTLALSPDGRLLATASSKTINGQFTPVITLWDAQTGTEAGTLSQPAIVTSLVFSPDGALLAAGNIDGHLLFWDVGQQAQIAALNGHVEQVNHLAFSPNGRFLAASDGQLRLWHLSK